MPLGECPGGRGRPLRVFCDSAAGRTETEETNRRVVTLIMRGLSATEAAEQARREAGRESTGR